MPGRSLHDALLTVLANGEVRAHLLTGSSPSDRTTLIASDLDWDTLSALPRQRLIGISRLFARQYYRERIVRLFRYVRLLIPVTGRDPCRLLHTPAVLPILDGAVLGSSQTCEHLLALIEPYLMDEDERIQAALPWWRDLVRYQATLFRVEAARNSPVVSADHPRRAAACQILDLDWDVPALLQQLRTAGRMAELSAEAGKDGPVAQRVSTTLLVACGQHGRITTIRCDSVTRAVMEAADGTRDSRTVAQTAGIPLDQTIHVLQQLQEIGALL